MKSLLVIDDKRLRKTAFAQAEKLIKKLERIEADLKSFETEDQRLYSNWFELTFRAERKQITDLQDEYRKLTQFHNWMIAEAQRQDISIAEAFEILRDEEGLYARGTDADRARIDDERARRERFIRDEIDKEFAREEAARRREAERERRERAEADAKLATILKATDEEIAALCRVRVRAIDLLETILELSRTLDQYALFIRVWDLTPKRHQAEFARYVMPGRAHQFEQGILEIREALEKSANMSRRRGTSSGDETTELDPADAADPMNDESRDSNRESSGGRKGRGERDDGFIDTSGRHRKSTSPDEAELIKMLYRKLVRRLHPDLQTSNEGPLVWQKAVWNRVQSANLNQDLRELEKLFRIVLIRGRELNEITMSEILESQNWLREELDEIGLQVKRNKNAPAWGFSRRKDYAPLKRKVEKQIMMELLDISDEVDELKAQREHLEMLARSERSGRRLRGERAQRRRSESGRGQNRRQNRDQD